MENEYILISNGELYHYGVPGMKWGVKRPATNIAGSSPKARTVGRVMDERQKKSERQKQYEDDRGINPHRPNGTSSKSRKSVLDTLNKKTGGELAKRGKSALDVLLNGDTDWMGRSTSSDNVATEAKNRGKAAIERLMYSEDQIDNKKFFGRYNF